jgi:hypothetical protein
MEPVTAPASPADTAAPTELRPPVDAVVCRLLGLAPTVPVKGAPGTRPGEVQRAFSKSMLVSAARCLLTYIVLPFVAPLVGAAKGVGPVVGITLGVVAIVFNVLSIRRFWAANHKWRWAYTAIGLSVIALLLVLIAGDLSELLS